MIRAFKLTTGADGHSHVETGSIGMNELEGARTVNFEETAAHASLEWHNAPTTQYVITLSGILEFTLHSGDTFTIKPGDVLIALDTTGTGHKWRLVDDRPWKRVYVAFDSNAKIEFVTD